MAWKGKDKIPGKFSDLLALLNNAKIQQTNNPLFQVLSQIIKRSNDTEQATSTTIVEMIGNISNIDNSIVTINGKITLLSALALLTAEPLTGINLDNFPNYRELLAGTNVTFDDTVANQRTVNVTATGANPDATYLTVDDESADLPNSRQELPGDAIAFDDTITNERTVNVLVDGVTIQVNGSNQLEATVTATPTIQSEKLTVDGVGSVITTGIKGYSRIPYSGTIVGWTVLSTDSSTLAGDIEFDVFVDNTYPPTTSIVGSVAPNLSSQDNNDDGGSLTGWTTGITANDYIGYEVVVSPAPATVTRVVLLIHIQPS